MNKKNNENESNENNTINNSIKINSDDFSYFKNNENNGILLSQENQKYVLGRNTENSITLASSSSVFGLNSLMNNNDFVSILSQPSFEKQLNLQEELNGKNNEINILLKEIKELNENKKSDKQKIETLKEKIKELNDIENIRHLLISVNEKAKEKLLNSKKFIELFNKNEECDIVVMSIDIRRSTELMLKAKHPKKYADFITILCKTLSEIIKNNFGIFDKFTGDGILCYFPKFYSGDDSILYALKSAKECHDLFYKFYYDSRNCFTTVLKEVGLGIGIDYGKAYLVNINNQLTVVGNPVVYACRMSGANYGETLLNQPAYELIEERYKDYCEIEETELNLKHEGKTLAYKIKLSKNLIKINEPEWIKS